MSSKSKKVVIFGVPVIIFIIAAAIYLTNVNIPVLQPKGIIGQKELHLMVVALLLSLVVVIPVFVMTALIAFKYRETNTDAEYKPNWDRNGLLEIIWWAVPATLIFIIGALIWNSSYSLDPYKPLISSNKPITIQVIALDWKWLFVYPDRGIASLNYFQFPNNTPVNFTITSDAPMNSFWIPQLGGQIYAMPGMSTQLHLSSKVNGSFNGSSANISGKGFSGMTFVARASSRTDFDKWVSQAKHSPNSLNALQYNRLSKPSRDNHITLFGSVQSNLYNDIVMKYMLPVDQQSFSSLDSGTKP